MYRQTDRAIDPDERAAIYNELDALIAQDTPVVPLYQFPTFFAWADHIEGPRDNPTQWGPFWNVNEWRLTE
jgi:peptide/nickel transport system substrate-binding protein